MKRTILAMMGAALVAGCSINLDAPLLPNVGKHFPEGTSEAQAGKDLTALSKAQAGSKRMLVNLIIDEDLADDLDLDRENNCAQLNELPDKTVIIDFYNIRCPANSQVGPVGSLSFTSAYAPDPTQRNHYLLKITGRDIGEMQINSEGTILTLDRLCTGRYDTTCIPSVSSQKFVGAPTLLY